MNIRLEKLFLEHSLSEKDQYEIRQIYQFLSPLKRQNLIDNFSTIIGNLEKLNQDIEIEQEILLGKSLSNIELQVEKMQKGRVTAKATDKLLELKNNI